MISRKASWVVFARARAIEELSSFPERAGSSDGQSRVREIGAWKRGKYFDPAPKYLGGSTSAVSYKKRRAASRRRIRASGGERTRYLRSASEVEAVVCQFKLPLYHLNKIPLLCKTSQRFCNIDTYHRDVFGHVCEYIEIFSSILQFERFVGDRVSRQV